MGISPTFHLTEPWLRNHFPDLANFQMLGQGGQKLVFAAQHAGADVVLKIVQPNHSVEDVRREILAVQTVQSSRVPAILAHGSIATPLGSAYWIREQRVHGQTVRQLLAGGALHPHSVLHLGRDIIDALVRAESVNIVHRDVKPDNIIRDNSGSHWLLDFGLARHLTLDSQTATILPFGKVTWGYSPPEQCRNDKPAIDARADLFAFGVTLYECATGVNPFRNGASSPLDILQRVERQQLPPLILPISQADEFRSYISALVQKRRDHRPANAREAQAWLLEICRNEGL